MQIRTQSLIKYWPWRSSSKQVIFLNELEEVLELLVGPEQIAEASHSSLQLGFALLLALTCCRASAFSIAFHCSNAGISLVEIVVCYAMPPLMAGLPDGLSMVGAIRRSMFSFSTHHLIQVSNRIRFLALWFDWRAPNSTPVCC